MTKPIDEIVASGNLQELTSEQRLVHYNNVCDAMGIDPRPHPLEYMPVDDPNGGRRLILYALKNCTDQLRANRKIKIVKLTREITDDMITFTAEATDKDGGADISTGSVTIKGKKGVEIANASMAAETKAKRRVTLSISGSGLLDETEITDINAPASLPAGMGVTAQNVSTPKVNESSGAEVKLDPKPESKKAEAPVVVATVSPEQPATLSTPAVPAIAVAPAPEEPSAMKKNIDKVYEDGANWLKNKKTVSPVGLKIEESDNVPCSVSAPTETQAVLIQPVAENSVVAPASEVPVSPADTKDEINRRITAYKRDILPAGGMRPSKGFGINAKFIKYFLIQFPDRKTINEFTNDELLSVLAKLDKARVEQGDGGLVHMIDTEIGTK